MAIKYIPVDKDKLTRLLLKKGYTMASASRGMGRCDTYLSWQLSRKGALNEGALKMLDAFYGIKLEQVRAEARPALTAQNKNAETAQGDDDFMRVLCDPRVQAKLDSIVYTAISDALENHAEKFKGLIKQAVKEVFE